MAQRRKREDDADLEAVHLLRATLPTRRHAQMLFEAVRSISGTAAVETTARAESFRRLYRRDVDQPELMLPWRWLELHFAPKGAGAPEPAPRLRGLGAGHLEISDGRSTFGCTYDERGQIDETSRSGDARLRTGWAEAIRTARGGPIDALIDAVARMQTAGAGTGRLLAPAPVLQSFEASFAIGLAAVRDALFEDDLSARGAWIAADGYAGTVVVSGATSAEALASCREEIERARPVPLPVEPAVPPPEEVLAAMGLPSDLIVLEAPRHDAPAGDPSPENTPIFLTQLSPLPREAPALGRWIHLLDHRGTCVPAVLRRDREGSLVISAAALTRCDPSSLDAVLAAAERRGRKEWSGAESFQWAEQLPPLRSRIWLYELARSRSGEMRARICGLQRTASFSGSDIHPEMLGDGILKQSWVVSR